MRSLDLAMASLSLVQVENAAFGRWFKSDCATPAVQPNSNQQSGGSLKCYTATVSDSNLVITL